MGSALGIATLCQLVPCCLKRAKGRPVALHCTLAHSSLPIPLPLRFQASACCASRAAMCIAPWLARRPPRPSSQRRAAWTRCRRWSARAVRRGKSRARHSRQVEQAGRGRRSKQQAALLQWHAMRWHSCRLQARGGRPAGASTFKQAHQPMFPSAFPPSCCWLRAGARCAGAAG